MTEAGTPTTWDNAWREGHAKGMEHALGIPYREAFLRTMAMLDGKPLDTTSAQTENTWGEWVPAIPLPLFMWPHRYRCECGQAFWTLRGYRGHYALDHILGTP